MRCHIYPTVLGNPYAAEDEEIDEVLVKSSQRYGPHDSELSVNGSSWYRRISSLG